MPKVVFRIITIVLLLSLLFAFFMMTLIPTTVDINNISCFTSTFDTMEINTRYIGVDEIEVDGIAESDACFFADVITPEYADGYFIFSAQMLNNPDSVVDFFGNVSAFKPSLIYVFYVRIVGDFKYALPNKLYTLPTIINELQNRPLILRKSNFISAQILPTALTIDRDENEPLSLPSSLILGKHYEDTGTFDLFTSVDISDEFYGTIRVNVYDEEHSLIKITDVSTTEFTTEISSRSLIKYSLRSFYYNFKYLQYPTFDYDGGVLEFFVAIFEYSSDCVKFIFDLLSSFTASFFPFYYLR